MQRIFNNCPRALAKTQIKTQTPCCALVVFHTVHCGDYWCKLNGVYACALLKISNSPFCVIPFHSCLFVLVSVCVLFSGFEANILFLVL